jgi:hypothetical protein
LIPVGLNYELSQGGGQTHRHETRNPKDGHRLGPVSGRGNFGNEGQIGNEEG